MYSNVTGPKPQPQETPRYPNNFQKHPIVLL